MANDIEFVDGLIVKAPNPRAPDFVKAQISIKVEDLGKWLREKYKAGEKDWINIDVKEAKSGKWYCSVSTFKKQEEKPAAKKHPMDDLESDIPF